MFISSVTLYVFLLSYVLCQGNPEALRLLHRKSSSLASSLLCLFSVIPLCILFPDLLLEFLGPEPGIISWPQLSSCPSKTNSWLYSFSIGPYLLYIAMRKGWFFMLEAFPGRSSNFKKCKATSSQWLSESLIQMDGLAEGQVYCSFIIKLSDSLTLSVQFSHPSCPTLCNPRDCSMPGLPVHHQLPEFTQTPLSQWCHPTISSSVIPFSSCLQSFTASGSFQMSQLFTSGGQSIGVSASISVLPMNIKDWSPLGLTSWISLQSKGLSRVFSNTTVQSIISLALTFLYSTTLIAIHDYWKNHSLD